MNYEEDFEWESRIIEYGYYNIESEIDKREKVEHQSVFDFIDDSS